MKGEETQTILEESYEELKQMRVVKFVNYLLESKWGPYALPVIVLIDVYLLILPLEPILAAYAIKHKKSRPWMLAFVSTAVSLVGYLSLYAVGFYFSEQTLSFFSGLFGTEQIDLAGELLARDFALWGYALSVPAILGLSAALASVPVPLSVLTFSMGVFQVPLLAYCVMFCIGRYIRYYIAAWVGRKYGMQAIEAVFKNIYIFTLLLAVSILLILFKIL